MNQCDRCHTNNPDHLRNCQRCGQYLPDAYDKQRLGRFKWYFVGIVVFCLVMFFVLPR